MQPDTLNAVAGRVVRPVVIPSMLVAVAGTLLGCQADGSFAGGSFFGNNNNSRSTVVLDPEETRGVYTETFYNEEAKQVALPDRWLTEAQSGTARIEARRAAAQSADVRADADFSESMASADADIQAAFSDYDAALAEADRIREVQNTRRIETAERIDARLIAADADVARDEAFLSATVLEWQREVERLRSTGESEWSQSLAEHERMLSERDAVEQRGRAKIEQMSRAASLTEERARERVIGLRAEGKAVANQTEATVRELNQQIETVAHQTDAAANDMNQRARTLEEQSKARISDMLAESNSLEAQNVQEKYRLEVSDAEVSHKEALANASMLRSEADADRTRYEAEVERRRAAAEEDMELADVMLAEASDWVASEYERQLAEVSAVRAEAEGVEGAARARFVEAEIRSRASAQREEAAQNRAIARDELERIRAEAKAHALQLQAKLYQQIAKQQKKGDVTLVREQDASRPQPGSKNPQFSRASKRADIVDADRVAQFKIELARASARRLEADSMQVEAEAGRDEQMASFTAAWEEKVAQNRAWVARIDADERKFEATVHDQFSKADAIVSAADAQLNRGLVNAESNRRQTEAKIASLRAGAEALAKKSEARVRQLFAQAESARRNGDSQVAALRVQREAALRRGTATSRQLLVEADSLEQSQRAFVQQLREQVRSTGEILANELARMEQSAATFIAVAQANYDESLAMADTFERIAVANASELTAQHVASRRRAEADVAYLRDLNESQTLADNAMVERAMADAEAELAIREAADLVNRAEADAIAAITRATAEEQRAVADAKELEVAARFEARIASTVSDRDRVFAQNYLNNQRQIARTRQAVAEAAAYKELSSEALTKLDRAINQFNRSAQQNWASILANPAPLPDAGDPRSIYRNSNTGTDLDQFVIVPTDFDN